jgi:hypothetical protein
LRQLQCVFLTGQGFRLLTLMYVGYHGNADLLSQRDQKPGGLSVVVDLLATCVIGDGTNGDVLALELAPQT